MSLKRGLFKVVISLFTVTLLTACLGTDVKKLGQKAVGGKGTGITDSETFSITLAYRKDTDPDDGRLVMLQGVRDLPSASLVNQCGSTGATCKCVFYKSTSDTAPVTVQGTNGISAGNNSYSCTLPNTVDPDDYVKVRLKRTDDTKSTGFIDIKKTLDITDVIGTLDKNKVRGIYKYGCSRTFFEGEGVSASAVQCTTHVAQKLGLITATYYFNLWKNATEGNFTQKGSNSVYPELVCNRQFPKYNCDGAPDLRFGLYGEQGGPFLYGMTMVANPEGENAESVYGYVALPDSANNCPTGLIKVNKWDAQPQSIIQGSINGTNPPSAFVNQNNNLNSRVVEESRPSAFVVSRQPNATPCEPQHSDPPPRAAPGSCENATFGGTTVVQNVPYSGVTPIVCVIPKDLLTGLF